MLSGVIVAVLKEQFADHIVLSDSTPIPFPEGLVVKWFGPGSCVTIVYSRDDAGGEMVVQSVTRC